MPTVREKIENNLVVFFLGALLAGFLAGIGSYRAILEIAQLECLPKRAVQESRTLAIQTTRTVLPRGQKVLLSSLNLAVKLDAADDADGNYNPDRHLVRLHFYHPSSAGLTLSEANMNDPQAVTWTGHWLPLGEATPLVLGPAGQVEAIVANPKPGTAANAIDSVELTLRSARPGG